MRAQMRGGGTRPGGWSKNGVVLLSAGRGQKRPAAADGEGDEPEDDDNDDPQQGRQQLEQEVPLAASEHVVDASQARAVAEALRWLALRVASSAASSAPPPSLPQLLDELDARLDSRGLAALAPPGWPAPPGDLARPRRFEVAWALNRLRSLRVLAPADEEGQQQAGVAAAARGAADAAWVGS